MKRLSEVFATIEENKKDLEFLKTGFTAIDDFLDGGFLRKELIVLGAGTGMGKSFVAGQVLWNIAQQGFHTAYFSLEISNQMIVSRLVGALANIKPTRILHGFLELHEHEQRTKARAKLVAYESFMTFYDNLYTFHEIVDEIRKHKYEFVVIDFVQNVLLTGMEEYARLSTVALELQRLAKETNTCVLLLSQLSNAVVREKDKSGVLEYKGSGSIATVCDLGFTMQRGDDWANDGTNSITLFLKKNRRGISGQAWTYMFVHPGGWIR